MSTTHLALLYTMPLFPLQAKQSNRIIHVNDPTPHQSSASLAFVRGIHRWPVNSPHKWPVTRKMFPFDDVIMFWADKPLEKGAFFLAPLLQTWFNFNPSMDKQLHPWKSVGCNYLSIPKLQRFNRWSEVWLWISNFILHFTGHVITYPCRE